MLLYVYDKTITLLGVVEEITSLIWTEKKYTYGTFQLLAPATAANIALMQENALLLRDDDPNKLAGEILYTKISKASSGAEMLEVTGRLLSHWLADRIIPPSGAMQITGTVQTIMVSAVFLNAMNDVANPARNYPNLEIDPSPPQRPLPTIQYKNEDYITLLALCEELAASADVGFGISLDPQAKWFWFKTYTGADHTINSNSPCIFSVEYENILEQEYTKSTENLKNVAYITGDDKSTAPMPVVVGNATGHDRKEVYIAAGNLKQGAQTAAEYLAQLHTQGTIMLGQYIKTANFNSKINANASGFKYGVDYTLGDVVTCINTAWGITINATITEAETTYQDGQKVIYLTFGQAPPTLFNKLKNLTKR